MKYAVEIGWEWGLIENKIFETEKERDDFLQRNEEAIYVYHKHQINKKNKYDPLYDLNRNMSDYEMDVYL